MRCDMPIVGAHEMMMISNMHFRIFLNSHGIVMIEDTSSNGTWVDTVHLQAKLKDSGRRPTRTIQAGSIIEILVKSPDECMRFVVNVPPRDHAAPKYNQRVREYLACVRQLEHQKQVQAHGNGSLMPPPAVLFGLPTLRSDC